MTSSQTARSRLIGRIAAVAVACGASLSVGLGAGIGAGVATAAPVAGQTGVPNIEQSVGTDLLTIQLTQGNPDDDGMAPSGAIAGVKIHLNRLAGIDPKSPADMARVENATLEQIQSWPTDTHLWQVTEAEGKVRFEGLADGIYLVTSTAPGAGYREVNSFLVAVPFLATSTGSSPVMGVIVAKTHTPGMSPPPSAVPPVSTTQGNPPAKTPSTSKRPTTPSSNFSAPGNSGKDHPSGVLALTGLQVMGLVALATILIGGGFLLIAVNRNKSNESEDVRVLD